MSSSDTPIGLASDEALERELSQRKEGRRLENQRKQMAARETAFQAMVTRLRGEYGTDEDGQLDIYSAWRDFHENWG